MTTRQFIFAIHQAAKTDPDLVIERFQPDPNDKGIILWWTTLTGLKQPSIRQQPRVALNYLYADMQRELPNQWDVQKELEFVRQALGTQQEQLCRQLGSGG